VAVTRNTKQRTLIKELLEEAGRPLSASEVAKLARTKSENIGTATIYRAINKLLEDGFLVPVEIPAEPSRYEVAGLHHHHHFYCRKCKKVFDVEGCPSDFSAFTPKGFTLDAHEVILYGRCADCTCLDANK
jgi:Fur family transcriptional regulator, ferric uptake regulator